MNTIPIPDVEVDYALLVVEKERQILITAMKSYVSSLLLSREQPVPGQLEMAKGLLRDLTGLTGQTDQYSLHHRS